MFTTSREPLQSTHRVGTRSVLKRQKVRFRLRVCQQSVWCITAARSGRTEKRGERRSPRARGPYEDERLDPDGSAANEEERTHGECPLLWRRSVAAGPRCGAAAAVARGQLLPESSPPAGPAAGRRSRLAAGPHAPPRFTLEDRAQWSRLHNGPRQHVGEARDNKTLTLGPRDDAERAIELRVVVLRLGNR